MFPLIPFTLETEMSGVPGSRQTTTGRREYGCMEIELLVSTEDSAVPLFSTARTHAEAAVEAVLL